MWSMRSDATGAGADRQGGQSRGSEASGGVGEGRGGGGGGPSIRSNEGVIVVRSLGILPETGNGNGTLTQQEAGEDGPRQESGSNSRKEQRKIWKEKKGRGPKDRKTRIP
ncbi:hypothetical protein AAFF_G00373980 [Aldrovandia affinis]|uniref:Uncharacterized protein n=1 Tax=Aldrovandia affinis TaxID=143900 RepID=A0AAD7VYF7_9TELE|nr:hypothetical protein AAFF_G00373980 [Aldrovandia affinis]